MKRIALLGLLSVAVMANENGFYVGGEVGTTHTKASDIISGTATNYTSNRISEALNAGYYLNQNSRAYVGYQHVNADMQKNIPASTNMYSVGYDYLFGTSTLKPFVGAILGYSTYTDGDFKVNGMVYGAQAGVDYKLNNNFSFDAGYRYLSSSAETTYSDNKSTMDSFQTFFVGAYYKF
ncbi:MAG: outer membrane beta-barrel protein [Sulfuricurvum sp.]|nr:outer membrane beta-barrel protein [Sulfuricurvum sp.]